MKLSVPWHEMLPEGQQSHDGLDFEGRAVWSAVGGVVAFANNRLPTHAAKQSWSR